MSWRKAIAAFSFVTGILLATPASRAQGDYLDVYIAKAKPEKAVELETLAAKIADANRKNGGDHVLAEETVYGSGYTYIFVSQRQDYADVDKASEAFMTSLHKAFGKQGSEKLLADWNNCLISSYSELRRRRPDLSRKMPSDPQVFAKMVGESRLLRSTAIHIRPGHVPEFEALLKQAKEAGDRNADSQPLLVSQLVEGGSGSVFYLTALRSSLGGFDKNPSLKDILGEEAFAKVQKISAESVETTESGIYRFRPDMSFPPDAVAQASADFWNPKPAMSAAAKPKAKTPSGADVTPAAAKSDKP
jgi:hypothetical protein